MSTPISSLTASGLTSLLSGMISQLSSQPPPPGSAHSHMSALAVLGGAANSSVASMSSASSTASTSSTSISILQGGHTNSVLSLALNANGTILASGGEDGHLCLWLTTENRLLKRRAIIHGHAVATLQLPTGNLHHPAISRRLAAAAGTRSSTRSSASANAHFQPLTLVAPIRHVVFANRPENDRRLFITCGSHVYEVDTARFEAGSGPFQARLLAEHGASVNQIALNDTETLIATCDDSGVVKVIELDSGFSRASNSSTSQSPTEAVPSNGNGNNVPMQVCGKTQSQTQNDDTSSSNSTTPTQPVEVVFGADAIIGVPTRPNSAPRVILSVKKHGNACSSICFRRCSRNDSTDAGVADSRLNNFKWQLISGGLDCKLQLVEFQRAGRSVNIFDMNEFFDQDLNAFAVNPLLIHTVAITVDGAIVACGLENGNIELFDARRKNLTHLQTLYAHSQAVTKVLFVPAGSSASQNVRVNYLVSAGNDGNIFCWEVKDFGLHGTTSTAAGHHSHDSISIKVVNCIEHWHKINWIEARSIDKVFIGDQSTQIASCSLLP